MSELDLLRQEATPRQGEALRVARRVNSTAGLIAYGVLWLMPSALVASLPIFAVLLVAKSTLPPSVAEAVMLAALLLFVLCWLAFGAWAVRRRRAARVLVRDGVLVDGAIDHARQGMVRGGTMFTAGVRFTVAGEQHRAVFAVARLHVAPGDVVPVLWLAGARHTLVFPRGAKHAVPARITHDIAVEHGGERTVVTFRRGVSEKIFVALLALVVPEMALLTVAIAFQKPTVLRCERDRDQCTLTGHDIFGHEWTSTYPASAMTRSAVERNARYGEVEWVVHLRNGAPRQLGALTDRAQQMESYRQQSDALNLFIGDRAQRSFEARFAGLGGSAGIMGVMALLLAYVLFALVHGWRTTLTFDRAAGTLTIARAPALLRPAQRTVPLASIARAEARAGRMWLFFASLPTLTLRLFGSDGKVLFKRKQVTSDDAQREIAAIDEVLTKVREARP
jgi:plastocyanin